MEITKPQLRAIIYFCWKNQKTPTQCKAELDVAFGDKQTTIRNVRRWYKRFRDGTNSTEDNSRKGRPNTSITDENIAAVQKLVEEDPHCTFAQMRTALGISSASLQSIVHEKLGLRKLTSRWIPHSLTEDQKHERVNWCQMMLRIYKNGESKRVSDLLTGDETWLYYYEPETKEQSKTWTFPNGQAPIKVKKGRSVGKRMFALFFRKAGFVAKVMVKPKEIINSKWYKKTLYQVFRKVRQKRPRTGLRCIAFHHDNASSHTSGETDRYFRKWKVARTGHPPYSPDLAPLDFFYISRIKKQLRGRRFQSEKELVKATDDAIKSITKAEHKRCFMHWFERMRRCIDCQGQYFEKL